MRLLIILALIYLVYRTLKAKLFPSGLPRTPVDPGVSSGTIEDVMVKDPFCGVYFPERNGVRLTRNGEDMHFCSEACRDKFIAAEGAKNK